MKRTNTLIMIICAVFIAANTFLLISLNNRIDNVYSRMSGLDSQLAGIRSRMSSLGNVQQTPVAKQKEVFTPSELAQYLNIEMSKIYDMIDMNDSKLPYVYVDGEYRFGKEAIDEWMKNRINVETGK